MKYLALIINSAYGTSVDVDPCLALFGVSQQPLVPGHINRVFSFSTLLARRVILLQWKSPASPSLNRWISEVLPSIKLEKLRFSLRGSLGKFNLMWGPLLAFLERQSPVGDSRES